MYRGQDESFWLKLAGFVLVPGLASAAAGALTPVFIDEAKDSKETQLRTAALVGGVLHAAGALGSWYGSESLDSRATQAFLRGGMWNELFCTVFFPVGVYVNDALGNPAGKGLERTAATISGTALGGKSNIDVMINLLSGGMMNKINNAPPQYAALGR